MPRPLNCKGCRKPKPRCTCGRKQFDVDDIEIVLNKLREAYKNGATDEEACAYAGISPQAYYRWLNKNEWFRDERDQLKILPSIQAKHVVVKNIKKGDVVTAKWYLERKNKDEFAPRNELTGDKGSPIVTIADAVNNTKGKQPDSTIDEKPTE